ncbi:Transposon Tn7 transposition protein TnsB [Burkholderia lata]|uniref:hypothetical protein n=1 Tax=Burkholderia lata (strain ATCC 17760 / DSM 23089 / LMG 22485 / NCIMB 9086 / R18194 / 383) TaxID=482957 RepID=UPI001453F61B|nr:hypothetical protein [Burkholderia lata]VWC71288.1 Transposon Tn7 transposition protein TnsB [Burkholderia lata]
MEKRFGGVPALRELYREASTGRLYRVVHVHGRKAEVILCFVFGSKLILKYVPMHEFRERSAVEYEGEGKLFKVKQGDDPYGFLDRIKRTTLANKILSDLNWKRIEPLVNDPDHFYRTLFRGADRTRILQDLADESGLAIQGIRKLHREYLQRGMTAVSVIGDLWRCGRRIQPPRYQDGEEAESIEIVRKYEKRPGRAPSRRGEHAMPTEALHRLFEQCIDIYVTNKMGPWRLDLSEEMRREIERFNGRVLFSAMRRKRRSSARVKAGRRKRISSPSVRRSGKRTRTTWQDLADFINYVSRCTRVVRDLGGQVIELELAPAGIVTVRQLTHYYRSRVDLDIQKKRAMGPREYALVGRPKRGHALQHSVGPGAEYMIDATIADEYLVLSYDRTIVVKRPTVYLVMDVSSRMVVGLHVTFDPPSFEGVALVLENIATPKDEFCARFGIDIEWNLWPCEYFPLTGFIADRGSDFMHYAAWQSINKCLATSISNTRAWDPTMRGLMERRFGIIPAHYQRASFGVVEADAATRGAPHYAWDATLTITEFVKKLIRAILRYNQTPIGREGAIPEMVTAGLADTPLNRWNWGLDNLTGSLRKYSIDEVRRATWPSELAKPTDRGLRWHGIYYTSPLIESKLIHCWGKRAGEGIEIRFNPDDLSKIIILGDDHWEYAHLSGTNRISPESMTLMEWEIYKYLDKRNAREQHDALEAQRAMDLLNNSSENRAARREQKAALKQAGIEHPVGQRRNHADNNVDAMKSSASRFGKFKVKNQDVVKDNDSLDSLKKSSESESEDVDILKKIAEDTRKMLDNL